MESDDKCELFYSDGGHGGPYESAEAGVEAAKRLLRGCRRTRYIEVRKRDFKTVLHVVDRTAAGAN